MISGKPCVLVVDDDPVSLGFLTAALGQCGCRAVPAASAHAALAALADATIDLLLIDRRLPDGDGDELLRRLRARGVVAPAVATSADITPADRERLIEAGFVATLGKPASVAAIHAVVERHLSLAAPFPSHCGEEGARDHDGTVLDEGAALAAIGGDRAAMHALRRLLAGELDGLIAALSSDGPAIDSAALADNLHRLRASCGFCGAPALGAAAAQFETCLRGGAGDADGMRNAFVQACIATRDALRRSG